MYTHLPRVAPFDPRPSGRELVTSYQFFTLNLKGGPEPLENEINKILGSKREDRFLDNFFRSGTKYLFGPFFVPASPQHFL